MLVGGRGDVRVHRQQAQTGEVEELGQSFLVIALGENKRCEKHGFNGSCVGLSIEKKGL